MKKLLFLLSVLIMKTGWAQSSDTAIRQAVIIHKDPRADALIKKQATINAATKRASARTMRGYRLMVVSTNKRDEAISAKTKIYSYYPELKAYLVYQSPFFRLKAGNFKTRTEAERYRKQMASIFPKGVFIVNDVIEVKPEKGDNDD